MRGCVAGARNVFGYRLRAGHISPYSRPFNARTLSVINGVPISSRYFLGGDTEVRGFPINSIAPLARVDRLLAAGDNPPVLLFSGRAANRRRYRTHRQRRIPSAAVSGGCRGPPSSTSAPPLNIRGVNEQQFTSPAQTTPPLPNTFLITSVRPLGDINGRIPNYRISLGVELRFIVPIGRISRCA